MKISFIADWRSPTARGWISSVAELGHVCDVLSTHPIQSAPAPREENITVHEHPIAASNLRQRLASGHGPATAMASRPSLSTLADLRRAIAPYDLTRHVRKADRRIEAFGPVVIHALRIPYAGMFASMLHNSLPLLVSVWGNDFTLHAGATARMRRLTEQTVRRADVVVADCERDVRLAHRYGLSPGAPTEVLPGGGGVDLDHFDCLPPQEAARRALDLPVGSPIVLNPRGNREYVRTTEYCRALVLVAAAVPDAVFVFADMAGVEHVDTLLRSLDLGDRSVLLPKMSRDRMGLLFRAADVSVSPSIHDGTPNTLLEAMAAGTFPVAGDIPSIREWLEHGANGLLCDPYQPESIAAEILRALGDPQLRTAAAVANREIVAARATSRMVRARLQLLYGSAGPVSG